MKQDNTSNPDPKLMETIMHMSRQIRRRMEYDSPIADLTLIQLETLIFLKKNPRVQMLDIADYFHIKKPSATSILNKLVRAKLAKRILNNEDRRIVQIELTLQGKNLLEEELLKKKKHMANLLSVLSKNDKIELMRIMNLIISNIETQYEK